MRWIRRIAFALVVVVVLMLAVGWRLLAGSRPQADGIARLAGLSAPVTVIRDANGIPTLTAANRVDLAAALGYLHGQERFFQMDLQRRAAAGELAELVGAKAVPLDTRHRMHRFRALAARELTALPPAQRQLIAAYTHGVNAGLTDLAVRPWEYLLLRVQPQPWTDADTVLTIDAMFLDLNQDGENRRELNIGRLRASLPQPLTDFLLAPAPHWEAPMQGDATLPVAMPEAAVFDLRKQPPTSLAHRAATRAVATTPGSNGFAVGGVLTGDGALLANDPHLSLRVPNIWYRAQLRYPDPADPQRMVELNGVTLPGAPAMVIGSNRRLAWGFTNSEGDWMDWVRVNIDPADPDRYKTPDGWASFTHHDEVIHVKDAADVHLDVQGTRWGPIMATDTDGTPLALAWTAQEPNAVNLNLMHLETADSVAAALTITPTMGIPPQNIVLADSKGHVAWTIAGSLIPLRAGFDPAAPADWSHAGSGWIGWATPQQVPRIVDPADARIWTANQRIVNGEALNLLGDSGYDQGARAQQIRDGMFVRDTFQPRDLLDIQLDDRALFLTRWQQLLLNTLDAAHDPQLLALKPAVEAWQARATTSSVGYLLVRKFRDQVREDVLTSFGTRAAARWPEFQWPSEAVGEYAVWTLVSQRPAWLLDPQYKDWNALLTASAHRVAAGLAAENLPLAQQTWGRANAARINNPLSVALPAWLARHVNMPHDPLAGDDDMPRVVHPAFGASIRMVVAPGDEAHGILEMPAGQSDNPLSPWFGAGHHAWVTGQPAPLLPGPEKYQLVLQPAR